MNRQEIVQALKALEEERRQAGLPDLRTLLDEEMYNTSQSFDERLPRLKALFNRLP